MARERLQDKGLAQQCDAAAFLSTMAAAYGACRPRHSHVSYLSPWVLVSVLLMCVFAMVCWVQ